MILVTIVVMMIILVIIMIFMLALCYYNDIHAGSFVIIITGLCYVPIYSFIR